jgi:hypothetical protein
MTEDNRKFWDAIENIQKAFKDIEKEYADMAEWCEPEMKLAVTKWAMKHIVDHAREGGSYRYLIYDRMGFGPEAYAPLCSDGMTISNEFDLDVVPDARKALAENDHDKLKKILSCCDEPGCYEQISAGFPVEGGYRQTCGEHYRMYSLKHQERKNGTESNT